MNPALAVVAIVVASGAVVCVSARTTRLAFGGLALTLVAASFLAEPLPDGLALGARVVAAMLAVYLPWIVVRDRATITRGSLLGWPVEALVAAAAFVIGFGTAGLGAGGLGPAEGQAAGFALVALAVGPIVFGRDLFRLGAGGILLVLGVGLVRVSLGGTPGGLEEVVTGSVLIGLGAALAFLLSSAAAAGVADGDVLAEPLPVAAATIRDGDPPATRSGASRRGAGSDPR